MYLIIWQYTINPIHRASFIDYYNSEGKWVEFFQQSPDYIGTDLLQSESENQFITIDMWIDQIAYENFLQKHQEQYKLIDKQCEEFTVKEILIGKYFTIE